MCARCSVREACLEYALDQHEEFGIWGGTSERERRKLRKIKRAPKKLAPDTALEAFIKALTAEADSLGR